MDKIRNINTCVITSIFLLGMVSTAAGGTIYVDAGASGSNNGSSWADAYNYLQDALAAGVSGDEIWVAQGTYKPDEDTANPGGTGDRTATFQLKNGVGIYGGFPAGGGDWVQRDSDMYETILSGDLNGNDVQVADPSDLLDEPTRAENSYHVVTGSDTNESAVLDDFTITAGNGGLGGGMNNLWGRPTVTNCTFSDNSANDSGGGMANYGSSPRLTDCTFSGNSAAARGGGMHNWDNSSPTLTNCTFSGNSVTNEGGGMANWVSSSPTLTNCTFSENSAKWYGGGMADYDSSSPTVTGCMFSGNSAVWGGGMYNHSSSPKLTNCTFNENSVETDIDPYYPHGGGMYNDQYSNTTLANCTFSGNWAGIEDWPSNAGRGGGMYNNYSSPTVIDCTFTDNGAGFEGGGMENNHDCTAIVTNCTFTGNWADYGGGMENENKSSPTLTNCTFSGNSARLYGGGMYNEDESSPTVTNCTFSGNRVTGMDCVGGGMCNRNESSPTVSNCTFTGNFAGWYGGGMGNDHKSNPTLMNCMFTDNEAGGGGGVWNDYVSSPALINCTFTGNEGIVGGGINNNDGMAILTNCILWGNNASDSPEIFPGFRPITVTYSDVYGGWSGVGNINADPLFVDAANGDYHLLPGSPCIDAGDNSAVLVATDLDGNQRIVNGIVDMGAYEAPLLDPVELVLDLTQNVIDLNLQQGIENGLVAKLEVALRVLDDLNENNDVAAIKSLEAFINLVETQRGKQISDTDADALIAEVLDIVEMLSTG